ncbi:hypothetical protein L596_004416 [Steinernema carpocapsae]|uniref:Doublecortin domain-containing protein n=2 Tax=Steinernema carpocapsae TaxID=34508 RepID=A0A4U8UVU7_STECR|nr:hypothetical protein L596_004416 [Steinernema carpocapsae]
MSVKTERVAEDNRPRTTKNVFIYKAGDHNWPGIRIPLNKRRHRSIDAVLDELTLKIPGLAYGVRLLTTPRGRHEITSIDQLQHLGSYLATEKTNLRAMPKTDYDRILENQRYNASFRGSMRCWHSPKSKSDSSQSLPIPRPARLPKLEVGVKRNKSSDAASHRTLHKAQKPPVEPSRLPPLNRRKLVANQQQNIQNPKLMTKKQMFHQESSDDEEDEEHELVRKNEAAVKIQRFYRRRMSKNPPMATEEPQRPGTGHSSEGCLPSKTSNEKRDRDETVSIYSNHSLQNATDSEDDEYPIVVGKNL